MKTCFMSHAVPSHSCIKTLISQSFYLTHTTHYIMLHLTIYHCMTLVILSSIVCPDHDTPYLWHNIRPLSTTHTPAIPSRQCGRAERRDADYDNDDGIMNWPIYWLNWSNLRWYDNDDNTGIKVRGSREPGGRDEGGKERERQNESGCNHVVRDLLDAQTSKYIRLHGGWTDG